MDLITRETKWRNNDEINNAEKRIRFENERRRIDRRKSSEERFSDRKMAAERREIQNFNDRRFQRSYRNDLQERNDEVGNRRNKREPEDSTSNRRLLADTRDRRMDTRNRRMIISSNRLNRNGDDSTVRNRERSREKMEISKNTLNSRRRIDARSRISTLDDDSRARKEKIYDDSRFIREKRENEMKISENRENKNERKIRINSRRFSYGHDRRSQEYKINRDDDNLTVINDVRVNEKTTTKNWNLFDRINDLKVNFFLFTLIFQVLKIYLTFSPSKTFFYTFS